MCFHSKWLINSLLKLFCSILSKLKIRRAGHLRNKVQGEISRKAGRLLQSISPLYQIFCSPSSAPPTLLFYSQAEHPSLINNCLFVVFRRKYKLLTMGFTYSSCGRAHYSHHVLSLLHQLFFFMRTFTHSAMPTQIPTPRSLSSSLCLATSLCLPQFSLTISLTHVTQISKVVLPHSLHNYILLGSIFLSFMAL